LDYFEKAMQVHPDLIPDRAVCATATAVEPQVQRWTVAAMAPHPIIQLD